ncbi:MAG TPA: sugar phosphate isomerase/epimerase, partial [Pirellulaceae bacterium]
MSNQEMILLSGFADEIPTSKDVREQFASMSALGFQRVALRFVNLGSGVKHVVDLSDTELAATRALLDEYGLRV